MENVSAHVGVDTIMPQTKKSQFFSPAFYRQLKSIYFIENQSPLTHDAPVMTCCLKGVDFQYITIRDDQE